MMSNKSALLDIPLLTITNRDGITKLTPELFVDKHGDSLIRRLSVEMGLFGEPAKLTIETFAPAVMLELGNPVITLMAGPQEVAEITLKDGTRVIFD